MAGTANAYYNSLPPDYSQEHERWRKHPSTRQLALDVLTAWRELEKQAIAEYGHCPFVIGEVEDEFGITEEEMASGYVKGIRP